MLWLLRRLLSRFGSVAAPATARRVFRLSVCTRAEFTLPTRTRAEFTLPAVTRTVFRG